MTVEEYTQLDLLFDDLSIGIVILDATHLNIHFVNAYAYRQLEKHLRSHPLQQLGVQDFLPEEMCTFIHPILQQVATTKQQVQYTEVPYEGFQEERGRTYWRITIKSPPAFIQTPLTSTENTVFITLEDVTQVVRTRLYMHALERVSSAIATGAHALPLVLDRILDAVHELTGSTHCAILLIDTFIPKRNNAHPPALPALIQTVTIAAQRGLSVTSPTWQPLMSNRLLLARVAQTQHSLIISDTHTMTDLNLPRLDIMSNEENTNVKQDEHTSIRAALSIPILVSGFPSTIPTSTHQVREQQVIGSIELYDTHPRDFAPEEVELLEHLAQQAGLAIQNTRLFRNIDQLARTEQRSAHQKSRMMQAIPDGIIVVDPRWRIAETNLAIRTLMGWRQEQQELLGVPLAHALRQGNAHLPALLTTMDEHINEFEQKAFTGQCDEFKMTGANARNYTIRCTYTPVSDDIGDVFAFIIVYHDITEQVATRERIEAEVKARTQELAQRNQELLQAQLAQETEHARLELLIEQLPSGVLLVSQENTSIITINNNTIRLLHLLGVQLPTLDDPKQLIGTHGAELLSQLPPMYDTSGSRVSYEQQPLALALTKGETTEIELHTQDEDGQIRYLLVNAAPLRTSSGTISSAALVLRDITTLKLLERVRENFFTAMAHELKTPLANARAHLGAFLMNDVAWSPDEQKDFILSADEQIKRLVGMIDRVLDASRVEAGALRPLFETILLPELIEDLQDRLAALISSSQRHLRVRLPSPMLAIYADYEMIMSVLINLLNNAFRYAPEGDTITLEALCIPDPLTTHITGVTLSVCDHGPGLTAEQQKLLFRRFSTFPSSHAPPHTSQRQAQWSTTTGLGLYICRGIIEAHHSTLQLASTVGQGTCFSFTLPTISSSTTPAAKRTRHTEHDTYDA